MIEIILPSGRFARIYLIRAIDLLTVIKADFLEAALISRVVIIDDKEVSYEEALFLPIAEYMVIMSELSKQLPKPRKD